MYKLKELGKCFNAEKKTFNLQLGQDGDETVTYSFNYDNSAYSSFCIHPTLLTLVHRRRLHRGNGASAPVLSIEPGQTYRFAPVLFATYRYRYRYSL
jgi:hypothetical protein